MRRKRGLFELAEGGTLLLNEIAELPLQLQSKLLTFLDTRRFRRVGGEKEIHVSARLIAATNRDPAKAVSEGGFRQDLYYRLNVFSITIPPLRERAPDIPILVQEMLEVIVPEMQLSPVPSIHPEVIERFRNYSWPGNVRELRNVLERALILSRGRSIGLRHVRLSKPDDEFKSGMPDQLGTRPLPEIVKDVETSLVKEALARYRGKKAPAARLLGITRWALARLTKKLGIPEQ